MQVQYNNVVRKYVCFYVEKRLKSIFYTYYFETFINLSLDIIVNNIIYYVVLMNVKESSCSGKPT